MRDEFHQRGLEILCFPCNQFLSQEPQGAEAIETCIRAKYGDGFRLFDKVHVNGKGTHDIFRWCRLRGSEEAEAIPWNFSMFLVGRDGQSCTRYSNSRTPASIRDDVLRLLEGKALAIAPPGKGDEVCSLPADSPDSVMAAN